MSTSAGWDGVLDGIINEDDCRKPNNELGYPGNCGSATIGIAFLLSYLVISFLIVINMYIAVILENYSQVYTQEYFPAIEVELVIIVCPL
jgi:voltage-gated sodium channel type II alpha